MRNVLLFVIFCSGKEVTSSHCHILYGISSEHQPLMPRKVKVPILNVLPDTIKCERIIKEDKNSTTHFLKMHTCKSVCTYMCVHRLTVGASDGTCNVSYEERDLQQMLQNVPCDSKYLTQGHILNIFRRPYLVQDGIKELLKEFKPVPECYPGSESPILKRMQPDGTFDVVEEEVMNSLTNIGLKIALNEHFNVEKVVLPNQYKKNYSLFSRSVNDSCLYHKESFYNTNLKKLTVGIIGNATEEECNLLSQLHDHIGGGVIEHKTDYFAVSQTIKEMICTSGKLLAKVLLNGGQVCIINMYGLAFSYDFMQARLVHLMIDLEKNSSQVLVSDEAADVCPAMMWLLNSIAPYSN